MSGIVHKDVGNTLTYVEFHASDAHEITSHLTPSGAVDVGTESNPFRDGYLSGTIHQADIDIDYLSNSTYKTLQDLINNVLASGGYFEGGEITDNGDGSIRVSSGSGIIRSSDSPIADSYLFTWNEASSVSLTDNSINYIYVDYNGGNPVIGAEVSQTGTSRTRFYLGKVYREGTTLHITQAGLVLSEVAKRLQQRIVSIFGEIAYGSGLAVSEAGTRNLNVSPGNIFAGLNIVSITEKDTSGTDTFRYYYRDGTGGWTYTDETQISNQYYDDGTGTLATLTANRYGVHWVYICADDKLCVVYGQGDYTLAQAEAALPPSSLPDYILHMGILVAKIIIQKNDTSFYSVESAFEREFIPKPATDHGSLTGLGDDDHTQYVLVNGSRSMTGALDTTALKISGTEVITNARVLQNVTANASIITSGIFNVDRIPDLTRSKITDFFDSPFWNNIPDKPSSFTPSAHASSHESGGSDAINHDNLSGFVANEHIDHTSVNINTSYPLSGGGNISANRTLSLLYDSTDFGIDGSNQLYIKESGINHDSLNGFIANEHINHTSVSINTSYPLSGGGDISTNRTISLLYDNSDFGINGSNQLYIKDSGIVHDSLSGFVANEHINHSSVSIIAGTGLTGGGDLTASRTISLSHLGLESLSDPNADRIVFWDDSAGSMAYCWIWTLNI